MDNWQKQTKSTPLFPEIEWDKPERKDQAGKLLIIGGNLHGFAAPAKAMEYTIKSGIGYSRVALPDCLRSTLHAFWVDAVFCPSTPSGSFSQKSLDLLLQSALWADGVLLSGDLGRNSETSVLLDSFSRSITSPMIITKDALDYFLNTPKVLLEREETIVVASFSQLQKLLSKLEVPVPITFSMSLLKLVETLHEVSLKYPASVITKFEDNFIVAHNGRISTTQNTNDSEIWRLRAASSASVAVIQNPKKIFEALTHSIYSLL